MIGYLTIHAQDASNQTAKSNTVNKTDVSSTPIDLKLPPIQGGSGTAASNNPAKPPASLFDPKIPNMDPSGKQVSGSTNPNPPVEQQTDPKLNADGTLPNPKEVVPFIKIENKVAAHPSKGNKEQPAGAIPKDITNYRNIKGPATQPVPSQTAKVINYRELKGPKTQPTGELPKR